MDYRIIGDDGVEYGPADLDALRQWAAQGRVSPLTMVKRSDSGRWAHAENYEELAGFLPRVAPPPPAPEPGAPPILQSPAIPGPATQPPSPPPDYTQAYPRATADAAPVPSLPPIAAPAFPIAMGAPVPAHGAFPLPGRGDTVLALGLISLITATVLSCGCLGLFVSPATGIPAWIMGAGDLRKIDAGLISPFERANTKGGMICGILGTFFGPLAVIGLWTFYALAFASSFFSQ